MQDTAPPFWCKFSHFHAVFGEKWPTCPPFGQKHALLFRKSWVRHLLICAKSSQILWTCLFLHFYFISFYVKYWPGLLTPICRNQQKSRELDIVTGFQLLDGEMHLFVLEGLRNGGIQRLWEALPKPKNSGKSTFWSLHWIKSVHTVHFLLLFICISKTRPTCTISADKLICVPVPALFRCWNTLSFWPQFCRAPLWSFRRRRLQNQATRTIIYYSATAAAVYSGYGS